MNTHSSIIAIIEEVLASLSPLITGHGGSISLVKYENDTVYVQLAGNCVGCPASIFTLKLGVEEALKAKLPHLKEVIALEE